MPGLFSQPIQFHRQFADLGSELLNLSLGVSFGFLTPGLEQGGHLFSQSSFPGGHLGGMELVLPGDLGDRLPAAQGSEGRSWL